MCPPCNNVLERRFERITAGLVRNVFSDPTVRLGTDETERVALWLLKTWLLLSHPDVHYAQPLVDRLDIIRERHALPQECYSWLITGDKPPPGISLWASRTFDDGSMLSRSTLFRLEPLDHRALRILLDRGLEAEGGTIEEPAADAIVDSVEGDGPALLTTLEVALAIAGEGQTVTLDDVEPPGPPGRSHGAGTTTTTSSAPSSSPSAAATPTPACTGWPA